MKNLTRMIVVGWIIFASAVVCQAGVVYTDIADELVKGSYYWDEFSQFHSSSDHFSIDLNNDGANDVSFFHSYSPIAGAGVDSSSDADLLNQANSVQSGGNVAVLNENTLIGPASNFGTGSLLYAAFPDIGNWGGQANQYMGVKFKIGTDWHYGWIRMSVAGDAAVTIYDYAYQTQPNIGITGAETPEPATLVMLALGGLAVNRRRRTR